MYLLPLGIGRDFQLVGSFLIAGIGFVGIICLLALCEGLSKAVYRLTNEHIEEEYGIVYKRLRRIPLSCVRDVTHSQNFLQAIFGVSSITVSPTNGDRIVLSNVKHGIRCERSSGSWRCLDPQPPDDALTFRSQPRSLLQSPNCTLRNQYI